MWVDPVTGEDNFRCPHRLAYEAPDTVRTLFQYYKFYKDGFLPSGAAITDEPNALVEYFGELTSTLSALDREDMDKDNSGNDQGNSNGFKSVIRS